MHLGIETKCLRSGIKLKLSHKSAQGKQNLITAAFLHEIALSCAWKTEIPFLRIRLIALGLLFGPQTFKTAIILFNMSCKTALILSLIDAATATRF